MENEYILSFSSFYKAAYAKDVLEALRKLPPQITHSCSTGLYLRIDSIERVRGVLAERQITTRGIYQVTRIGGTKSYRSV